MLLISLNSKSNPPQFKEGKIMKRALIVIDVQNEYVTGNLPIDFPELGVSLPNIARAMDAASAASIPVVVVQQVAPVSSPIFAEGSEGWKLHELVASRARDHLVEKKLPSCFTDTDLSEWLDERGIDTVAIVGYMTQNCDESTARDAVHRGLLVEFLSDATGTLTLSNDAGAVSAQELHEAVLVTLQSRFAAVASTDEWIASIADDSDLPRSNIYASTEAGRLARAAKNN